MPTDTAPEWILLCTIGNGFWLIDIVNDEIAAIDAYRNHINVHGLNHARHIGMYRSTRAIRRVIDSHWHQTSGLWNVNDGQSCADDAMALLRAAVKENEDAPNLFRVPDLRRNIGTRYQEATS